MDVDFFQLSSRVSLPCEQRGEDGFAWRGHRFYYVANAENLILTTELPDGQTRCLDSDGNYDAARGCSHPTFRDIELSAFGNEATNSCLLFGYDEDDFKHPESFEII